MIIDLRGTSGSGKSTAVRALLNTHFTPLLEGKRVMGYHVTSHNLHILGRYSSPTGGADTYPDMDLVIKFINTYAPKGHVIYEGLRTSGVYGRLGANSEQYEDAYVFAFLDTPLVTCIENVDKRRAARGAGPLADHKHTVSKHRAVQLVRNRLALAGRRVVDVPWLDAPATLLRLLNERT